MMGRSHALSGAAGWLALAPPVAAATDTALGPVALAAGAVVTAGAALVPDLDTPHSTISRALGPVSQLLAVAIAALAGGHRHATHSLAFVAAIAASLWAGRRTPAADAVALVVGGLCVGLAIRALGPQQMRSGGVIDLTLIAWTVALTGIGWAHLGPVPWLPAAVALGAALHIAGDLLTPEGCPLLWPHPTRHAWPILSRTGGPAEALITAGLGLLVAYLSYTAFAPALLASAAGGVSPPGPEVTPAGHPSSKPMSPTAEGEHVMTQSPLGRPVAAPGANLAAWEHHLPFRGVNCPSRLVARVKAGAATVVARPAPRGPAATDAIHGGRYRLALQRLWTRARQAAWRGSRGLPRPDSGSSPSADSSLARPSTIAFAATPRGAPR